jgi:hypothetical protein
MPRQGNKVINMETYEPPKVLATYTVAELVEEAAVCMAYGSGGGSTSQGAGPGGGNSQGGGKH